MKYKITCESSADLNQDMYKKLGVAVIPFRITLGSDDYFDGKNITNEQLFEYVNSNSQLPKTSALNENDYTEFWEEQLKDCDGIIHFCISSKISSTYNNAVVASKKFNNVYVIDSMSLSSGIGLQVLYATELRDNQVDIEKAVELINKRREHVQISFVVDKLNYLYKGGRCSALALLGANILKIKPQIILSDGRMIVGKKYMGNMTKVVDKYIDDLLDSNPNPILEHVFITHSSPMPEAEKILTEKLENRGFKYIHNTLTGGTISSHCGPNCIGVLFLNK